MITLWPDSAGSRLREYNTCHDPDDGRFCSAMALSRYREYSHEAINSVLRGERRFKDWARQDAKADAEAIDYAFTDPKMRRLTTKATKVYRGIASDVVHRQLSKARVGQIVRDKAFLSTSFVSAIADHALARDFRTKSVKMIIRLPKGMPYLTGSTREREAILPRDLALKVVDKVPGDPLVLVLDAVPRRTR